MAKRLQLALIASDRITQAKAMHKDLVKNMLKELHLKGVGPAPKFDIEFGDRLNILTGDNGLGKSFIVDVAWFALTE
jgi:recombinational DNA repair ATPase RecF